MAPVTSRPSPPWANVLGLVKLGTGTLRLTADNTYTGLTTVAEGTLQIGNGAPVGSVAGDISVASGASLVFARSSFPLYTYAGAISGAGSVTTTGAVKFTGTNTHTGSLTVGSGTLTLATSASLYNGDPTAWSAGKLTVNSGAGVVLNAGGTGEFTASDIALLAATGTATSGFKSGSSLSLSLANAPGGTLTYGGVFANPNGGANTLTLGVAAGT
ncbi:MAG: autotransporter-associated beta strand repeat-containing protein, partial [Verrucomicrobia bacterium]|nr:autotransporter-associated beta strand repeat-containing protein [Verrucomicrobiota bacterium]